MASARHCDGTESIVQLSEGRVSQSAAQHAYSKEGSWKGQFQSNLGAQMLKARNSKDPYVVLLVEVDRDQGGLCNLHVDQNDLVIKYSIHTNV